MQLVKITWSATINPKDWGVNPEDTDEVRNLAREIFTGEADPPDQSPDIGIVWFEGAEGPPADGFAIAEG